MSFHVRLSDDARTVLPTPYIDPGDAQRRIDAVRRTMPKGKLDARWVDADVIEVTPPALEGEAAIRADERERIAALLEVQKEHTWNGGERRRSGFTRAAMFVRSLK